MKELPPVWWIVLYGNVRTTISDEVAATIRSRFQQSENMMEEIEFDDIHGSTNFMPRGQYQGMYSCSRETTQEYEEFDKLERDMQKEVKPKQWGDDND